MTEESLSDGSDGARGEDAREGGSALLGSEYTLGDRIGRGATGEVRKARSRLNGRLVAVKLLRPDLAEDRETVGRFLQERSILTAVKHPNVVGVIDLVVERDSVAIVMDLVPGGDLRSLLQSAGTLAPSLAVEVAVQILDGLTAVHAAGVLHRDLKPENVLLDLSDPARPLARITDFGIAKLTYSQRSTRTTSLIGTPDYMAPELVDRGEPTVASDVYAVGVLLYELLCGRTPFAGGHTMMAVLRGHLAEIPLQPDGFPDGVWATVADLLAKDPRARPQSANEVSLRLAALLPALAALPAHPRMTDEMAASLRLRGAGQGESDATSARGGEPTLLRGARPMHARSTTVTLPITGAAQHQPQPRRHQRVIVAVAAAALLAVVASAVGFAIHRGGGPAGQPPVSFDPVRIGDLVVTRQWQVAGGANDRLHGTLHVVNVGVSGAPQSFDEVIAKQVVSTAYAIQFDPQPEIVQADPVVRYHITGLAAQQARDLTYDIPYTGATPLVALADDEKVAVASIGLPSADAAPSGTRTSGGASPTPADSGVALVPPTASAATGSASQAPGSQTIVVPTIMPTAGPTPVPTVGPPPSGQSQAPTATAIPAPAAPFTLSVTPLDAHSIRIDWADASINVTGHRVRETGTGATVAADPTSPPYTWIGLDPGSSHCFAVQAYNSGGDSPWSGPACVSTQLCPYMNGGTGVTFWKNQDYVGNPDQMFNVNPAPGSGGYNAVFQLPPNLWNTVASIQDSLGAWHIETWEFQDMSGGVGVWDSDVRNTGPGPGHYVTSYARVTLHRQASC